MSATTYPTPSAEPEPRFLIDRVGWDQYVAISDALSDRPGLRMVYLDARLTFSALSRRHAWIAERLGDLVVMVANGFGLLFETAGAATFRREAERAAVEGDKTFYFREHAERMRGPQEIDLTTQPPPDLAIQVEVTHPAGDAIAAWGRIGVPEVWRFDAMNEAMTFLARRDDGDYAPIDRSLALPALAPTDVVQQLKQAASIGASRWFSQLNDWVRRSLMPRFGGGG